MRILNTKDAQKQYSKFSMPGFRSDSMIKKLVACIYYFSVLVFTVYSISMTLTADFIDARDIALAVVVELVIVMILIAPVIIVGFSDYYDWHGIKLVLIILVAWCVLFTVANYICTLFSPEFINSTNASKSGVIVTSDGEVNSDAVKIDGDIIINSIDEITAENSAASK